MAWLTDFWELWTIAGVAVVLEWIAVRQGKGPRQLQLVRTISSRLWLAVERYAHFTPLFCSFWTILVPHIWLRPTTPGTWTTPEGWAVALVATATVWLIYGKLRGFPMPGLTIGQRIKERPLWLVAVAGIIVQVGAAYGLELDKEWLLTLLALITGLVTYIQQRKVTPMAKLDRLEVDGHVAPGTVATVKTPNAELPQPFPQAQQPLQDVQKFPADPLDRRR